MIRPIHAALNTKCWLFRGGLVCWLVIGPAGAAPSLQARIDAAPASSIVLHDFVTLVPLGVIFSYGWGDIIRRLTTRG